jgi:hypothetical protein
VSLYQALSPYRGQEVNIVLRGSNSPLLGTLKLVSELWIIMETELSIKQYVATDEIVSFWTTSDSKKV